MRILIAEDDATSRLVLKRLLSRWEYEVVETSDGEAAWEVLRSPDSPPLAILDWIMPGLDGVDVCRKVREQNRPEPHYLILLTSLVDKKDIVTGLDAGANDYIGKPFNAEELRARIRVGERVVKLQQALSDRVRELQEALDHIKTLQGIIPICMHCHKIRTDQEAWQQIDDYVSQHTDAHFSHGLCPECAHKYYPDYFGGDGKSRKKSG